jgi:hypothetical protein
MARTGRAHALQIAGRRGDRAGVAHRRLHDHRGDVAAGETPLDQIQTVPGQYLDIPGGTLLETLAAADRDRRLLVARDVEGRRGRPQHVVEPAVVMAFEFQDLLAPGGGAGEAESRLHDLRS